MKPTTILLADGHNIVRSGLRYIFHDMPHLHVVAEASDGAAAVEQAECHKPDVAILAISMPVMDGVEATRRIKASSPQTRVLIFTLHNERDFILQLISAGADGYLLKDAEKQEVLDAVAAVAAGERSFSPRIQSMLVDRFIDTLQDSSKSENPRLTRRELQVLQCIARGLTNQEIGDELFISPLTVHTHRNNLLHKLDVHDTAALVRYAIEHKLTGVA